MIATVMMLTTMLMKVMKVMVRMRVIIVIAIGIIITRSNRARKGDGFNEADDDEAEVVCHDELTSRTPHTFNTYRASMAPAASSTGKLQKRTAASFKPWLPRQKLPACANFSYATCASTSCLSIACSLGVGFLLVALK